jgi:hypothetical protein
MLPTFGVDAGVVAYLIVSLNLVSNTINEFCPSLNLPISSSLSLNLPISSSLSLNLVKHTNQEAYLPISSSLSTKRVSMARSGSRFVSYLKAQNKRDILTKLISKCNDLHHTVCITEIHRSQWRSIQPF